MAKQAAFTLGTLTAPGTLVSKSPEGLSFVLEMTTSEDMQEWEKFHGAIMDDVHKLPTPLVWKLGDPTTSKVRDVLIQDISQVRRSATLKFELSFIPSEAFVPVVEPVHPV